MAFSILSLDGGGIRGVLTARLLERIADVRPDYLPQVQLIAGTYTGSILAIGLANGLSPSQLVRLYQDHGRDIFHTNVLREIIGLDAVDKIDALIQQADTVDLTATLQFIDAQCLALPKVDPKVEREGQP